MLDEVNSLLEKLGTFSEADASEVSTLWGYYYTVIIVTNPASGKIYFRSAIGKYELAISQNPENPRPVCLLALFRQNMPPMMRTENEIAEGKTKAEYLFAKESVSWDKPGWGRELLKIIK